MKIINQVIYDMREQPLASWISVGGTALAIFLIMVIYMVNGLGKVESEPELRRSRLYYGTGMHIIRERGDASSYLSQEYARRIYGSLEGVEQVAYTTGWGEIKDAQAGTGEPVEVKVMYTDRTFWDIYDFRFAEGRPYAAEDCEAAANKAVITSRLAERLFGKGMKAEGEEIMLDLVPYTVAGVVSNANPLMAQSYSDVYLPLGPVSADPELPMLGNTNAHLLLKPGADPASVREQVSRIYGAITAELKKDMNVEAVYHGQPYDAATMAAGGFGTNGTPDTSGTATREWVSYIVLLLLPAINLSTMTRARMRRRVSEIGVRRAFGAKRFQIVTQLLVENLLLTLLGGLIGLALSVLFAMNFSQYVVTLVSSWNASFDQLLSAPGFSMLLSWRTFFMALAFCVALNIISAGIPAIKASRVNPADALGARGK